MAIDPVWAGVVGTAVGAVAGSAASLLAPLINWKTEKQRLEVEKQNAKDLADQEHKHELERIQRQSELDAVVGKRELISTWRTGVAESVSEWVQEDRRASEQARATGRGQMVMTPISGRTWFESLRPNLDDSNTYIRDIANTIEMYMTPEDGRKLFDEIARIEHEWGLR